MAVINRKSLVLCGFTVLRGGKVGNARLGSDYAANLETPEIRISMRHPSLDCRQEFQPVLRSRHADDFRVDSVAALGAGRSHRRAGVLSRRSIARLTWCKPANQTSPASAWGYGVR
jgi:hypothetical protein